MNLITKFALSAVVLAGSLSFAEQRKEKFVINVSAEGSARDLALPICGNNAVAKTVAHRNGNVSIRVEHIDSCSNYWTASTGGGKLEGFQKDFSGEFLLPSNQSSDVEVKIYLESGKAFDAYKRGDREGTVAVITVKRPQARNHTSRQSIYLGQRLDLPNCDGTIDFKSSDNHGKVQYNLVVRGNTRCTELSIQNDDGSRTIKSYPLNPGQILFFTISQSLIADGFKIDLGAFGKWAVGESNLVRFMLSGSNVKADIINARFVDYGRLAEADASNPALMFMPSLSIEE